MVVDLARRGVALRSISDALAEAGHPLSKDAVARHLLHAAPDAGVSSSHRTDDPASAPAPEGDVQGLVVARAAASVLEPWPSLASELTVRLIADGALDAARVVLAVVPELMHPDVSRDRLSTC